LNLKFKIIPKSYCLLKVLVRYWTHYLESIIIHSG